jgi:LacI family transcriptional regulator
VPITIKDVADHLDLSVTTVSRALAGYSDVADATRVRVSEAADELGYVPTHAARQLRRQKTETIGLIFPTMGARFSDPFFSEFMAGIVDQASHTEHDVLVSVASEGESEQLTYGRLVRSRRVDGFILVRMRIQDWRIRFLVQEGIPFVAFGRSQTVKEFPHVGVDGREGMRQLVQHIVETGRIRIGYISAPEGLTLARDRLLGYKDGLKEAGIVFDEKLVACGELTTRSGFERANDLLDLPEPPQAIIGANDLMALGAMRAVQARGLRVGKDLAIAGFDGTEASELAHPPLTTISQPVYDIGHMVCQMLISIIQGETLEKPQRLFAPELIVRPSTLG